LDDIQIRRQMLQLLYDAHRRTTQRVIEEDELAKKLDLSANLASSNLLYLSESGLVQVQPTSAGGSRIYHYVRITSKGINLVDDPNEFNERFPPIFIIHNEQIAGDKIQATIGDHARNIIVGKEIDATQIDHSVSAAVYAPMKTDQGDGLKEAIDRFVALLDDNQAMDQPDREAIIFQLERLQETLSSNEIDLGTIQHIKHFLRQQNSALLDGTRSLFSHPAIVALVKRAVAELIGPQ